MHELGHAFGLAHDVRVEANWWTAESIDPMITSFCAAEMAGYKPLFQSYTRGF